jgi:hypothetical protein
MAGKHAVTLFSLCVVALLARPAAPALAQDEPRAQAPRMAIGHSPGSYADLRALNIEGMLRIVTTGR